jgi:hypothetical protein
VSEGIDRLLDQRDVASTESQRVTEKFVTGGKRIIESVMGKQGIKSLEMARRRAAQDG